MLSGTHKPDDVTYNVDYVVISEPALTAVMGQNASRSQYKNLTEEYVTKSEGLLLPQASVFVRSSLDQEKIIDPFYEALSSSINQMINSPDLVESNMNKDDDPQALFSVVPAVAKVVTANGNRMGLGCKQASQIKSDINQFLSLFGVSELKDESIAK